MAKTFTLNRFAKKIRSLNPDISVDTTGDNFYGSGKHKNARTGIHYKEQHICNVDKGDIPEFDIKSGGGEYNVDVSPTYALAHKDTCTTQHILIDATKIMMLDELNTKMGLNNVAEVYFGTRQVIATREKVVTYQGEQQDAIMIRRYFKKENKPSHIERLGWRYICQRLINSNIPGITLKTLSKALGTELVEGFYNPKA